MKIPASIFALSLAAFALGACSGGKADGSKASSASDAAPAADSPSASQLGDATFSANIDGVAVTGSGVDEMQQRNAAYVLPVAGTGPKHLVFYLYSTKNAADESANFSFRFWIPPKTGTSTQRGYTEHSCDCSMTLNENITTGDLARYNSDTIVVNVTSMTATRVTGTFSGSFVLSGDTPRAPNKRAKVTDGKFDIPMATSKVTPE